MKERDINRLFRVIYENTITKDSGVCFIPGFLSE
jgi:hypothetical protein